MLGSLTPHNLSVSSPITSLVSISPLSPEPVTTTHLPFCGVPFQVTRVILEVIEELINRVTARDELFNRPMTAEQNLGYEMFEGNRYYKNMVVTPQGSIESTARTRRRRPRCKEETDPGWEERKAKWEERKAVKRSRIEAGLPVHPDSDDTDDTE